MHHRDRMLTLAVAVLCIACSRHDSAEEAAQAASSAPTDAMAVEGVAASSAAAPAAPASATPPAAPSAATAVPDTAAGTVAATPTTTPGTTAPPVSNDEDQVALARADTSTPAVTPDNPNTAFERAAVTHGVTPLHSAMTSHADHHGATDATTIVKTPKGAARMAQAVSPALLRKEDVPEKLQTYSAKLGDVVISNLDPDLPVHFAMQTPDGNWQNEALDADETDEFDCGLEPAQCVIWMKTGTTPPVSYNVWFPRRYAIFWNGKASRWDLRVMPPQ